MAGQPNVLFLLSDEHSHRFIGSCRKNAENAHTPNLDKLAENGMVFSEAYCQTAGWFAPMKSFTNQLYF